MTTALLAFWTCCVGGDAPGIEAIRAARKRLSHHQRALAAKKTPVIDIGELFGMETSGRPKLAGNLAVPFYWKQHPTPSIVATKHFEPRTGVDKKPLSARPGPTKVFQALYSSELPSPPTKVLATKFIEPLTHSESKHPPTKNAVIPVAPELRLCSVNVSDYDMQKFLPLLTQMTGLNIILMSTSPAKVTMHVEKMKFIDIMRHVCALTGFAYVRASDAYILAPKAALRAAYPEEYKAALKASDPDEFKVEYPEPTAKQAEAVAAPDPIVTRTFIASYIKATQLVETLKKFAPKELDVVAGPNQETPSLSNVDPSEKTGQGAVTVSSEASSGAATRTVILHGAQSLVAAAIEIAKQLDVPRAQVSIAVTIHDIQDDAVKDLGLSWNFTDLTLTETPAGNGISVGKVTRSPMTFDAAISALETKDVARLLASPNVSLLDGEKAFVLIGDKVNYPVLTGYTATNSPIFSVNTERVGVYLQVAANISSDGYITLMLYPQVSSISGYLNVNGASYPQITSREAQTTLRVKSGETIVLGGLLQDTDIMNVDKVPILSSIPLFGELFKHRTKTKNKSQVIITIRPVVIPLTTK